MTARRILFTALVALVAVVAACGPPPAPDPTTTTTSTTSTTTTTTAVPLPASIDVELSQPSHGDGVRVIGGQSAPLEYVLTVTNSGDEPSGPIVVTDTVHRITTLVEDSASCGTTPACTVAVTPPINSSVGPEISWMLDDVAPRSSVQLMFAATVNDSMQDHTSITSQPLVTNVNTPSCTTPTCARNVVTNPAEAFGFDSGWLHPFNSVFYSGLNVFWARDVVLNDPEAEIVSYHWSCYPETLCTIEEPNSERTYMFFKWDLDEHVSWSMYLTITARRGDETITRTRYMDFDLMERPCFGGIDCPNEPDFP